MYELQGTPAMMSVDPSRGGRNPQGGKVFFVHESNGNDSHEGTDPQFPLATLAEAYAKCTAGMGDYIFVEYFSTLSAPPLAIAKRAIHLISLSSGNFDSRNDLNGGDQPAIRLTADGRDLELAGFNLGGDGTSYGLEVEAAQTGYRFHIHHCTFGNNFGVTDGIHAAEISNAAIDHCLFGSAVTGYGMNISGSVMMILAHNIFHSCDSGCIYLSLGAVQDFIFDNMFAGPINGADGWAIDLPVGGTGSLIMGNKASECGDDTQGAGNPYRDRSANSLAAKLNAWAGNIIGNAFGDPKATV
jgi:hypothetical protein